MGALATVPLASTPLASSPSGDVALTAAATVSVQAQATLTKEGLSANATVDINAAANLRFSNMANITNIIDNGGDSYTIEFVFPRTTPKKFDPTGYTIDVNVDVETDTSGVIPFLPQTGQTYVDLVNPDNTAGTLGETYAGDPAATGDQWVYDSTTNQESIPLTVDVEGYWILDSLPTVNNTADFYRIDSLGTVDVEDIITFALPGSGGSGETFQQWIDSLTNGGFSTTEKLIRFLRGQGMTGGVTEMMYEYLKTVSTKASHSERWKDWESGGFN